MNANLETSDKSTLIIVLIQYRDQMYLPPGVIPLFPPGNTIATKLLRQAFIDGLRADGVAADDVCGLGELNRAYLSITTKDLRAAMGTIHRVLENSGLSDFSGVYYYCNAELFVRVVRVGELSHLPRTVTMDELTERISKITEETKRSAKFYDDACAVLLKLNPQLKTQAPPPLLPPSTPSAPPDPGDEPNAS